jgi:hypothetical protein
MPTQSSPPEPLAQNSVGVLISPEPTAYAGIRRAAWFLGAVAVFLICVFDLGPPLAFNDDWIYALDVQHFNLLHLHLYPFGTALALVQIVWAWLVTLGHPDQRLLRLSIVPFVLLTMYALHRLARLVGADKTWSAIAAIAPLAFPVFTADATTFMSDIPYVALMLVAALGAVRWSEGRKWIVLCVVFAILTTLQRQAGVTLPVAVTLALLWRRGNLRLNPDGVGLILLWLGCLATVVIPTLTGVTSSIQGDYVAAALAPNPTSLLTDLLFLPGMVGLGLILFLPGLIMGARRSVRAGRTKLWITALALWEILVLLRAGDILPGNVFSPVGLNSVEAVLGKVVLYPFPIYLGLEIAAAAALLAFVWRWRDWWPAKTGRSGMLLLLLAIAQFLPLGLLHYLAFDRYYLPVVLALVPIAARVASQTTRPVLAARLALTLTVVSIGIYAVGEQDYQAWQVARNYAACLAYQYAAPFDVYAGYEANAVYGVVPYYERTGVILGGPPVPGRPNFSVDGPADPIIRIVFAGPNDPRPGYNYSSWAPGKVVLMTGPRGAGVVIKVPGNAVQNCPGGG